MSSIEFNLGAARHALTLPEAGVLRDWLGDTRALAAQSLAASLRKELDANRPHFIQLGLDDIAALRSVLCETKLSGLPGLESLKTALCRPESLP
jgi:hypothetical protein